MRYQIQNNIVQKFEHLVLLVRTEYESANYVDKSLYMYCSNVSEQWTDLI